MRSCRRSARSNRCSRASTGVRSDPGSTAPEPKPGPPMYATPADMPVTLTPLEQMKRAGEKIAALTAYDASFARVLDESGVELVLVGDSLGNVIQGHASTL